MLVLTKVLQTVKGKSMSRFCVHPSEHKLLDFSKWKRSNLSTCHLLVSFKAGIKSASLLLAD